MHNKKVSLYFSFILAVIVFASCSRNKEAEELYDRVNCVIEENPDSALNLLDSMKDAKDVWSKSYQMKYELFRAKAQNKAYVDFTTDSIMKEVVDYYDDHGTPNEQMEAHYLLGCVYRDLKESPMAIQCFLQAVDCADTTGVNCDYSMLYRVYGQMSNEFARQYLYEEAIKATQRVSYYAMKAGELDVSLQGEASLLPLYERMGNADGVVSQTKRCVALYKEHGMPKEAAKVYLPLISVLLDEGKDNEASRYLTLFEKESGLLDENNNVKSNYEAYYNVKGLYFLHEGKTDSARIYYEKLKQSGDSFTANVGLFNVHALSHGMEPGMDIAVQVQKDMVNIINENKTNAVMQVSSMYNYNRLQKDADMNRLKAERAENILLISAIIVMFIIMLTLFVYASAKKRYREKLHDMEHVNDNYLHILKQLEQSKEEMETSVMQKDSELNDFRHEIELMTEELNIYKNKHQQFFMSDNRIGIDDNETYKTFKDMAKPKPYKTNLPQESDWNNLMSMIREYYPIFYKEKIYNSGLPPMEARVCVLLRIHFSNNEIENLLDISASNLSNIKKRANQRLFNDCTASTLQKNLES